jgi:hypothetical protein
VLHAIRWPRWTGHSPGRSRRSRPKRPRSRIEAAVGEADKRRLPSVRE